MRAKGVLKDGKGGERERGKGDGRRGGVIRAESGGDKGEKRKGNHISLSECDVHFSQRL